ncbi:MAG: hypothetical protein SFU98_04560 [Leptospiraceae bacterium]|nr:hypothetical protein [Leptospiraceae bacterium]
MKTITLEILNNEDEEMIIFLAKRLNLKVVSNELKMNKINGSVKNSNKALKHLDNLAKLGTMKDKIPDPVKWQRKIRKDRKLVGR